MARHDHMEGRNHVVRRRDGTVVKQHVGPEGEARAATAAAALRHAAAHDLPAPRLRAVDGAVLTMTDVGGSTLGATLLGRSPAVVLRTIGSFARRLHDLPPPGDLPAETAGTPASTWVHGDLCPVNVLFAPDGALAGVVDWEDSHVGDPLVDLVWTEWLVRAWHDAAVPHLGALYDAYDEVVPPVDARRRAMVTCLVRQGARATDPTERAVWDHRVAELADLDLTV